MSFIHVNNHPHAKTLFVACCKMSHKHLIAGYHHDKQTNNLKSLDSHLFACVRWGRWWWPRYVTFGSLRLECESELKGGKVDALIWNQSCESCSTTRSSWNKTILASQTHFQNIDNESWKPLSTINSKFPVAVHVGKGLIWCQFAESWNMLEGFVI